MPLYGRLPDHAGERRLARTLLALDDGRLHLWFDLNLPRVPNVDVLVWDEPTGVFVLEAKAVPLDWVEEFSPHEAKIRERRRGKPPQAQARDAMYGLKGFIEETGDVAPWMSATAAWPCIRRADWSARWAKEGLPDGLEASMVFEDDLEEDLAAFRARLEWLRGHSAWGNGFRYPFEHRDEDLGRFARRIGARRVPEAEWRAWLQGGEDPCGAADEPEEGDEANGWARPSISLGTESVEASAEELRALLGTAREAMPGGWLPDAEARIDAVMARLREPFRIGVVGEFRAGKSSLVNALLGETVAPVSEFECTFAPQRLYWAEEPEAFVRYVDGRIERRSIEELLTLLEDPETAAQGRVERTEVGLPAPILRTVELWDAPGFGGSERNAKVAKGFLEGIDAGLWVFNKDYMGQRAIDAVLQGLRQGGKLLVGVVNKCEDLFVDEYARLRSVVERSYPEVSFAAVLPFSAALAQEPEAERLPEDGLAVAADGNLGLLVETLRGHILADPHRLGARAAAGTLRSIAHAARDAVQGELLAERRRLYLFETQRRRSSALLARRMEELGRRIEQDAVGALRERLTEEAGRALKGMAMRDLRDPAKMRRAIEGSMDAAAMDRLLTERFEAQRPWVEEFLREVGIENASDYEARLTVGERLSRTRVDASDLASQEPTDVTVAATVAGVTGASLGFLALLIPGPQWPFVVLGTAVSFWASRKWKSPERDLPEEDLRRLRLDEWASAINDFLLEAPKSLGPAIEDSIRTLSERLDGLLHRQMVRAALGDRSPQERLEELRRLEAIYRGLEFVIEGFGDPTFELPAPSESLRQPLRVAKGDRERSAGLLRRVLTASSEVVAIRDGWFGPSAMPLLLETVDAATVRLLAWRSPLSAEGEAFAIALSELRGKRTGGVSVVSPVPVEGEAKLEDGECWIFVPGWAYRFSRSLAEVYAATEEFEFTPYEDNGSIYQEHFGRYWDGDARDVSLVQV